MDFQGIIDGVRGVLQEGAQKLVDKANETAKDVEIKINSPEVKAMIEEQQRRERANTTDKPINKPETYEPRGMIALPPIPSDLRQDTARLTGQFIDAMDRVYNENSNPADRDKFMANAFKYYTVIEPNEIMREILDSQGAVEQGIMEGSIPSDEGYRSWQQAKRWLQNIARDPYGSGAGLV